MITLVRNAAKRLRAQLFVALLMMDATLLGCRRPHHIQLQHCIETEAGAEGITREVAIDVALDEAAELLLNQELKPQPTTFPTCPTRSAVAGAGLGGVR